MSGGVPAGWVLVPVEPTEAMLHAAFRGFMSCETHERSMFVPVWEGMLSAVATPTPPIEGRDADVERVARALYRRHPTTFYDKVDGDCEMCWLEAAERLTSEYRDAVANARAALQALGERG